MLLHLRLSGILLIGLGISHAFFGRYLNWKSDLAKLTLLNRQVFYVHCFYIALMLVLFGLLFLLFPEALLEPSPLSRAILAGTTMIWSIRLVLQWSVFQRSLWNNHRSVYFLLTILWIYLTAVNAVAFLYIVR